ncbi:hypothetical protein K469DRAFT_738413 [Zopfia rhizophila CBS 207.26]|uniref:Mid2 domain-containing protein n=1 Tax=Zopfia rhizophila CBS 207.26 TaxID=1314779 RepID=A0A6A6E7S3_9PEZI|nr:hypothetical protein K469DRAFT_738413 [Zopfia rhizophila CBS 207.26]
MAGKLPITLLSALAWGTLVRAAPSDPTITPPPLLQRQNDARFMGYLSTDGTWSSLDCDEGLTWYQDGKYAQCCATTLASCYAATACVKGSQIYPISGTSTTIACTSNYNDPRLSVCNTVFIFENTGDSNPKTDIICGDSAANWSLYRQIPETTESSSESSDIPSPSPTPTPEPSKESSSKAWIAGAVVGPIIGLAIIGAVVFLLLRRKKKQNATPPPPTQPPVQQYGNKPPFSPAAQYPQQTPQPSPGFNQEYFKQPYEQQASPASMPGSPAPQYQAPYTAPGSPLPTEMAANYAQPVAQAPPQKMPILQNTGDIIQPTAGELGVSTPVAGNLYQAAELSGDAARR